METTTTITPQPMPARRFKNRREELNAYYKLMGWDKPMTLEEKTAFDEAIRMVTNLD
jgi:hypothetical protein